VTCNQTRAVTEQLARSSERHDVTQCRYEWATATHRHDITFHTDAPGRKPQQAPRGDVGPYECPVAHRPLR
jgi:hypothetical protein